MLGGNPSAEPCSQRGLSFPRSTAVRKQKVRRLPLAGRPRGRISSEPRKQWRDRKPLQRLADHRSASSRLPAKRIWRSSGPDPSDDHRAPHLAPQLRRRGQLSASSSYPRSGPPACPSFAPGSQAAYYSLPSGSSERLQTTPSDYQPTRGRPAKAGVVGACPARGNETSRVQFPKR